MKIGDYKMRNPKRIPKILKELEKTWLKYPDLRLGQLIFNLDDALGNYDLYNVEDKTLIKLLRKYYNV